MELIKEFLTQKSVQTFIKEKQNKMTYESYLFYSPDSLTNKEYIKTISLIYMCNNNICLSCPDCLKILQNVHPDVVIFPQGKTLSVLDAKNIIEESTKKPMLCDKKIIVINDIDNSSVEAQNKLLKIIEEPPKNVVFLATATNMEKVLSTIKSRMQKRHIEPFCKNQIEKLIKNIDKPNKNLAIIQGKGYIGKTLSVLEDDKYFEFYNIAKQFVFEIKASTQVLSFTSGKQFTRETLSIVLENMSAFYRDIYMSKLGSKNLISNTSEIDLYQKVESEFSVKALLEIQKLLNGAQKKVLSNGNVNLIIETLLVKILEVKYLCK